MELVSLICSVISRFVFIIVISNSFIYSVAAQEPKPSSTISKQTQQQWLELLGQGKSITSLEEGLNLSARKSQSHPKPGYINAINFKHQIQSLKKQLNFSSINAQLNSSHIQKIFSTYDNLVAADLIRNEHYQINLTKITEANLASSFTNKLEQSQSLYQQKMVEILTPLKTALNIYQEAVQKGIESEKQLLSNQSFQSQIKLAIESTQQILNLQLEESPVRILRNNLPYRNATLSRRSPITTVSIIPSYESNEPPTSEDLDTSPEAPLSESILKKAEELDHDYIKIYDFVHNQIKTEWYVGASKGAEGTLLQLSGNDIDQASLLIALFRASGLASRYVHGVIELPVETVNASLGLTTSEQAIEVLNAAGFAYSSIVRGGKVVAFKIEYSWVSAYIPYNNYRGAVVDRSGEQWLPLMPALKDYDVKPASGLLNKAGINIDSSINNYLASLQTKNIQSQLKESIGYFLAGNPSEASYQEQLGTIEINPSKIGLIPNTLPVSVVAVYAEETELSENYQQKIRFISRSGTNGNDLILMDKTIALSQIANQRLTLSYMPASIDDHNLTNLFGGLDLVPTYLINLRPEIKLNGRKLFTAENAIAAGVMHSFDVEIITPAGTERLKHSLLSGGYHAITIATGEKSFPSITDDPADTEFLGARILSSFGQQYNQAWTEAENEFAQLLNVALVRPFPAFNLVSNQYKIESVLGEPQQLKWSAVTLDAGFRMAQVVNRVIELKDEKGEVAGELDLQVNNPKDFIRLSALQGSSLEHQLFEDLFKVDSISADKGLQIAKSQNQSILTINSANVATQLPLLTHPKNVIDDIQNWVTKGYQVIVPQNLITHNAWTGSVWFVNDLATGSSGYFIGGGLAGGSTSVAGAGWILDWLQAALEAANSPEANPNPGSANSITKYNDSGYLKGVAGQKLNKPFIIQVRDKKGAPVRGAIVKFTATNGAVLDGDTWITDETGLARAVLTLTQKTDISPIYQKQNESDEYLSQAALNSVTATVESDNGTLFLNQPFSAIVFPDNAISIQSLSEPDTAGDIPPTPENPFGMARLGNSFVDPITIVANDQFGNRVSNVDVKASISVVDTGCAAGPGMLFVGEKSGINVSFKTATFPIVIQSKMGPANATEYPVKIIGAATTLDFPFKTGHFFGWFFGKGAQIFFTLDGIHSIAAAKPGQQIIVPFTASYHYATKPESSCVWDPKPLLGNAEFTIDNGGSTSSAVLNGEIYQSYITVGPTPGVHKVNLAVTTKKPYLGGLIQEGTYDFLELDPIYAVETSISDIDTIEPSNLIPLSANNFTVSDATINYQILPAEYHAGSVSIDFLEDGGLRKSFIGSSLTDTGKVLLPAGQYFDPNKDNKMQVVLNRGTDFEIKSGPQNIPFAIEIITDFTKEETQEPDIDLSSIADLVATNEMDTVNNRSCMIAKQYEFEIAVEAKITLEIDGDKVIDGVVYSKGKHQYVIEPGAYSAGEHVTKITAVSTATGQKEEKTGSYRVTLNNNNSLPMGHTLVKGVDVSNGNLSLSSTDFSMPGRTQAFEFQRYYSSNNGAKLGPLGVGWGFNYDAKLEITPCSEIILHGGTGSGSRFVDDGDGNLVPLKGYHGSLKANSEDQSFDFYAKDGTRYHYKNYGRKFWDLEFIEDVNQNITKFSYVPGFKRNTRKLVSVEEPGGRIVSFTYENRVFGETLNFADVITKIEVSGGISIEYDYDDWGNLIGVNRSRGARTESYAYASDELVSRNKITRYTDPNGNATSYSYLDKPINFKIGDAVGLVLPYQIISSVTEPEVGTTSFSLDFANLSTKVTNPRGFDSNYHYNNSGAVVEVNHPIGSSLTSWTTDDVLITGTTDANGNLTSYSYDDNGNRLTETQPGNLVTKTTYYPPSKFAIGGGKAVKNRVASITDVNGKTTSYDYDSAGNLILINKPDGGEVRHSYNSSGDRTSTTDANGNVSRFEYDDYGNVTKVTNALGQSVKTGRDAFGLPTTITDANGNVTTNTFDSLQRLTNSKDALDGDTSFTYDPVGNKLSETNANGNSTDFTYDKAYHLTQITNANGDSQSFEYDPMGNKTSETDFNGKKSTFSYDGNDRQVTASYPEGRAITYAYDPVGNRTFETIGSQTTEYTFDSLNRVTNIKKPLDSNSAITYDNVGNVTQQMDPLGRVTSFEYDAMNRMTKQSQPKNRITGFEYDLNGNKKSETDANGVKRKYQYDKANRLEKITDANGETSTNIYDAVGNITSSIDARLNSTQFEYDALNRKIKSIDANNNETGFVFDKVGNMTGLKMANGNSVINVYDQLNRLTSSEDNLGALTTKTYDKNSNLLTETDAKGNLTTYVYDDLNRQTEQQLPENRNFKITYDIYNNKISSTDAKDNLTQYVFDDLNRLTSITYPDAISSQFEYDLVANKTLETDRRGNSTLFEYDDLNQLIKVTDPLEKILSFSYDLVGNKKTEINKKGITSSFTYDKENRLLSTTKAGLKLFSIEYDEVGNKAFETDALGNRSAFIYNKLNQLTEQSYPLAAISVFTYDSMGNQITARDPESRTSSFSYDLRNRLSSTTNGNNETTSYSYDLNGNQLTKQLPMTNSWTTSYDDANRPLTITAPDGGTTSYTYDKNGNRLTQQDALANTTSFVYDALNRQTSMTYPGSIQVSYEYDANGNRIKLTDANGKIFTTSFDKLNRKIKSSYPTADNLSENDILNIDYSYDENNNLSLVSETFYSSDSSSTNIRNTTNSYDDFDRLTKVINGDNKKISYTFDANGNRKTVKDPDGLITSYNYDALNRVSDVINTQGITNYRYDRSGRQTQVNYPNGTQAKNTYDAAGRTKTINNLQDNAIISKFEYVLDANGNRSLQTETQGAVIETTAYVYDGNDRLTQTSISSQANETEVTDFSYDQNYNRLTEIKTLGSETQVDKTFSYNNRGQVTKVTDNLVAANTAIYSYDNNGNRIKKDSTALIETYFYDVRDQLKEIKQGGSTIGQFLYDYQGLRVEKTTIENAITDTKKYVYDDQSVLVQTDQAGVTLSKYDYGSNRLLSMDNITEGAQFYLFDALGSPVNLTKNDGTVQARYQYDAFGNARSQTGTSANVFGFTGHEKDPETGLYYFKARYYDPTLGQFLTQDAFEGMTDTPPSLHKYIYAYGNPTVWTDPTGNLNVVGSDELDKFYDAAADGNDFSMSKDFQNIAEQQGLGDQIETSFVNSSNYSPGTLRNTLSKSGVAVLAGMIADSRKDKDILPFTIVTVEEGESTAEAKLKIEKLVGNARLGSLDRTINQYREGNKNIIDGTAIHTAKEHALAGAQRNIIHQYSELLKIMPGVNPLQSYIVSAADELLTARNIVVSHGAPSELKNDSRLTLILAAASVEAPFLKYGKFGKGVPDNPNRGLTFVGENLGTPRNAAMQNARDFESGTVGAFSDVTTKQRQVPALRYDNPNPNGSSVVKFDGHQQLDNGVIELIDSKTRIVPFSTKDGPFISPSVRDGLVRKSEALSQNPGYNGVIELQTKEARREAQQVLRQLGITNISTRVRK